MKLKKVLPLICISPFLIITFYWIIIKYIHLLFNIKDEAGAMCIAVILTIIVTVGIIGVILNKVID